LLPTGASPRRLLAANNPPPALGGGLLLASHLARAATAPAQQDAFAASGVVPLLPPLLRHPDGTVRARAANLLGNLCRHSDRLYPELSRHGVAAALIGLCADPDRSVRKFACFAIGNAGFHSAELYPELRPAVPALVALLRDGEDRTRANAAGALGNLLRNSAELVPDVVAGGALDGLLELVRRRGAGGGAGGGGGGTSSSLQIALFSLGNMCAHRRCAEALLALGLSEAVADVAGDPGADATVVKYVARVRQKLQGHAGNGWGGGAAGAPPPQQTPMRR